jgi:hypothetical protein
MSMRLSFVPLFLGLVLIVASMLAGCADFPGPVIYAAVPPAEISAPAGPCFNSWDIPAGTGAGCSRVYRYGVGGWLCRIYYPASADASRVTGIETRNCADVDLDLARKRL